MFSGRTRTPSLAKRRTLLNTEYLEARDVPAVVTISENYQAEIGTIFEVDASRGVLSNDFSTIDAGAVLSASLTLPFATPTLFDKGSGGLVANPFARPLPANTLTLNPDGSFRVVIPSNLPVTTLALGFSYQADNLTTPADPAGSNLVLIYLKQPSTQRIAVGAGAGTEPVVNVYETGTGKLVHSIMAYESTFTGGVRVAVADLNADGYPDIVTAPAVGGSARVRVFDGLTARPLFDSFIFEPTFTGGANIATGDFNGDGFEDLIIGAGVSGGPRVIVLNGQSFLPLQPTLDNPFNPGPSLNPLTGRIDTINVLANFYAYESTFRGGVRVAAGDIDGIGRDYVITAPAFGGGPVIKTFDYDRVVGPPTVVIGGPPTNGRQIRQPLNQYGVNWNGSAPPNISFYAGDANARFGVYPTAGDINGDGKAEVIVGAGIGPAIVQVYNGQSGGLQQEFGVPYESTAVRDSSPITAPLDTTALMMTRSSPSGQLLAPTQRPASLVGAVGEQPTHTVSGIADGGVYVATVDWNGDGLMDIITGAGPGNPPRVRIFNGSAQEMFNFLAFPGDVLNGVNVG